MVLQKRNNPKTRQKSQLVNNFYFQTQLIKIPTYCDVAVVSFHISLRICFSNWRFRKVFARFFEKSSSYASRKRHREKSNVYCFGSVKI